MEFKAVKIGGNIHASVNGVVSSAFARLSTRGEWVIMIPEIAYSVPTEEEAIRRIAVALGDWYTTAQAAARLVGLGAYDKLPSCQTIARLAQAGAFASAFKLLGKGGAGAGGQWRIPEAGLAEFAKRRGR